MTPEASPAPPILEKALRVFAALDCVLCTTPYNRYYSYVPAWGDGQRMARIDNGSGDHIFLVFDGADCFLKGLDHETRNPDIDAKAFFEGIPEHLKPHTQEPAFSNDFVSYCFWHTDDQWTVQWPEGDHDERATSMFEYLIPSPQTYVDFAGWYYETTLSTADIKALFESVAITPALAQKLNPEIDIAQLKSDLEAIGFPYMD